MAYRRTQMQGVEELKATLDQLGTEVATKIGVSANRKAAQVLRDAVKEAAPYDAAGDSQYGHLRDNIRVRKVNAGRRTRIRHVVDTGKAFWGRFLEFGTAKMSARPFMRPTFDRVGDQLVEAQIAELRTGIEKQVRRTAKLKKGG